MTPYIFMIVIWFALYYYLLYQTKGLTEESIDRRKKIFVGLAGTVLFVIMGLRSRYVGVDTSRYVTIFQSSPYYQWKYILRPENIREQEIGFKLYNTLLYKLRFSDQMYLILYAFLITFGVSKQILKYCKNPFLGFYLHTTIGLFTMSMSGIRQSLACVIIWMAIDCILEKKPVRYFLTVIVASLFHQSAIFMVVFYFARYIKIKKDTGWMLALFSVACIFLRPLFTPILGYFLPEKYEKYGLVTEKYSINPGVVLIALLIPIFCLFFWERHKLKNEKEEQFCSLCYAGSFCYAIVAVLSLSSQAINRMSQYFYIFNVILLGNIIEEIDDWKTRTIAFMFAIILPGYMFFKSMSLGIAPYYFFWEIYGM